MTNLIIPLREHLGYHSKEKVSEIFTSRLKRDYYRKSFKKTHRKKTKEESCFTIIKDEEADNYYVETGYYIGVDWVVKNEIAAHVVPKLNGTEQIDYLKMLFSSIEHPEVVDHITELFEIKWDEPKIDITQQEDLLTPFLIIEFLGVLKKIVKKGLKKSYNKVERNLYGRVKGKILVSKTIKHNVSKNENLKVFCNYEEFGANTKENRFLKKVFEFSKKFLPTYGKLTDTKGLQDLFHFINPAFDEVSSNTNARELRHFKSNSFFKEYDEAIRLGKLILERFAYNISNTAQTTISTPPFWIDMSKLFEFYVLGKLKDSFKQDVKFQYKYFGNELDFILKSKDLNMVIDAKYKPKYKDSRDNKDMRQVSGYARLKNVYEYLHGETEGVYDKIIDVLIIYPNQEAEDIINIQKIKDESIDDYIHSYRLGIKLPVIIKNDGDDS